MRATGLFLTSDEVASQQEAYNDAAAADAELAKARKANWRMGELGVLVEELAAARVAGGVDWPTLSRLFPGRAESEVRAKAKAIREAIVAQRARAASAAPAGGSACSPTVGGE